MTAMHRILAVCAFVIAFASIASAQDEGRIGVTMGYPSAVGILWRATDRIALRPEFTWTMSSVESSSTDPIIGSSTTSTPSSSWQTGFGLAALFYVSRVNGFGAYLTPRLAYSRMSTTTNISGTPVASSADGWAWTTSGAFGADYRLARHFGLFGEIGVSYSASTFTSSTVETITSGGFLGPGSLVTRTITLRSDSHTHSFGTRSGVGVIFLF
jgi:hypothetical protein